MATPKKITYLRQVLKNQVAEAVIEHYLIKYQGDVHLCYAELCGTLEQQARTPGPPSVIVEREPLWAQQAPGTLEFGHQTPLVPSPVPQVWKKSGNESSSPNDKYMTPSELHTRSHPLKILSSWSASQMHQQGSHPHQPGSQPHQQGAQPLLSSSPSLQPYHGSSPTRSPTGNPLTTLPNSSHRGMENTHLDQPQSHASAVTAITEKQREQLEHMKQHHHVLLNKRSMNQQDIIAMEGDLHHLRISSTAHPPPNQEDTDFTKIIVQTLQHDIASEEAKIMKVRRQSSTWECGECRFLNHPALPRCESCNSLRERSSLHSYISTP